MQQQTTITNEEQELLNKILATAQEMFMSIGVRSVTMDDLAGRIGISKKTVYQVIENKADLVRHCILMETSNSRARIQQITSTSKDAIEEMLLMGTMVITNLKRINNNTVVELKKFYPESWKLVERHHTEFIHNIIKNNLLKGINEGLYRPEINVDILARIYIGQSQMILEINNEDGHDFRPSDVYMEFFNYHIRGIASPKGVGKLAIYKNKIKLTV